MSRAGRKRKSGPREPNGQHVRKAKALREKENKSVVIDYRQRVFNRTEEQAGQPESESNLGRLAQDGLLAPGNGPRNAELLKAGEWYLKTRIASLRARQARKMASGGDMERIREFDASDGTNPGYVESCSVAIRINDELREFVHKRSGWRSVIMLDFVIWGGYEPKNLDDLRNGLNAIEEYMALECVVA